MEMGIERAQPIGDHLNTGEIAAYVDQAVSTAERERIEAHLATCDDCTEEVAFIVKTLDAAAEPTSGARRPLILVAAGIAAAVLAGSLIIGALGTQRDGDRVLRDSPEAVETGEPTAVRVVAPAEAGTVDIGRATFSWRAAEPGAAYNLTVTDEGGDVVWTGSTRDTAIVLTTQVVLDPGETYFWYVDAILPDGRTLSSGVRSFTAASPG